MKTSSVLFLMFITSVFCYGQKSFSMGAKIGYGTSAFPMNVLLESNGSTTLMKSGATLSTGVTGRYTIGDRIGIESGVWMNHYSFYQSDQFSAGDALWKTAAEFEIIDTQAPIIIFYQMKLLRHPFRYFIVGAGTSVDWLNSYLHSGISHAIRPGAFQNVISSLKTGRERPKGNKLEIGIEIQYSLKQFQIAHFGSSTSEYRAYSRLNMVSVNLGYFFLKKKIATEEI